MLQLHRQFRVRRQPSPAPHQQPLADCCSACRAAHQAQPPLQRLPLRCLWPDLLPEQQQPRSLLSAVLYAPQQWATWQRQALQACFLPHCFQLAHPLVPVPTHTLCPLVGQQHGLQPPLGPPAPQQHQLLQRHQLLRVQAAVPQESALGRRLLRHLPAWLQLQRRSLLAVGSAPAELPAEPLPRQQLPLDCDLWRGLTT